MPTLNGTQIRNLAKKKLAENPSGIRWTPLVNEIKSEHPETPINTIWGNTRKLFAEDVDVVKVSKGIYALKINFDAVLTDVAEKDSIKYDDSTIEASAGSTKPIYEKDFYEPFAEWLRDELEEVTEALAIGGNIFKGKWNTPDVIGVLRPLKGNLVKFDPQIVSAEIKIDPSQPIIAFGQAISYRLFSHKSYVVLPSTMAPDDLDRIIALATIFGLGFVTFNPDVQSPAFQIQVRASLAQPDMVYVNQMADQLNSYDKKGFDRLF